MPKSTRIRWYEFLLSFAIFFVLVAFRVSIAIVTASIFRLVNISIREAKRTGCQYFDVNGAHCLLTTICRMRIGRKIDFLPLCVAVAVNRAVGLCLAVSLSNVTKQTLDCQIIIAFPSFPVVIWQSVPSTIVSLLWHGLGMPDARIVSPLFECVCESAHFTPFAHLNNN